MYQRFQHIAWDDRNQSKDSSFHLVISDSSPGFPVEFGGVGEVHAAFLNESRTRGRVQRSAQEIRVHPLFAAEKRIPS